MAYLGSSRLAIATWRVLIGLTVVVSLVAIYVFVVHRTAIESSHLISPAWVFWLQPLCIAVGLSLSAGLLWVSGLATSGRGVLRGAGAIVLVATLAIAVGSIYLDLGLHIGTQVK
jgi:hypothetical protein